MHEVDVVLDCAQEHSINRFLIEAGRRCANSGKERCTTNDYPAYVVAELKIYLDSLLYDAWPARNSLSVFHAGPTMVARRRFKIERINAK